MKTEKHKTRATNWAKKANEKTVWVRNGLVLLSHSQCSWCMFFMHLYFRSLGLNFGSGFSFLSTTFVTICILVSFFLLPHGRPTYTELKSKRERPSDMMAVRCIYSCPRLRLYRLYSI
uniref:Uncharacterized protein n=1 Tax=Anopheles dirus TaxID=7168 RepID=A0A182NVX0_9DIPT